MMRYSLLIKNGKLVIPRGGIVRADIAIKGEKIACIAEEIDSNLAEEVIDASGKFIFPGLVEPHCHIGTQMPFWNDMVTETKAAIAGGITTVLSHFRLNYVTEGDPSFKEVFPDVLERMKGKHSCDLTFHFQIPSLKHCAEIEECYFELGIQSFKFFLIKRKDTSPGVDYGVLWYGLNTIAQIKPSPIASVHCEVPEIIEILTPMVQSEGRQGLEAYHATRPGFVEEMAIMDTIFLAQKTGAPVHIVHVTTREGVQVVRRFASTHTITAETQVHYLVLSTLLNGTLAKVNPPIRRTEDVEATWDGIKSGLITSVGTDHGAKLREWKSDDIWEAARGFPGMETSLPLMITHGTRRGLPLYKIAELMSFNNAETFGLLPRKGTLSVGSDGDITIVDLEQERTIRADDFHGASNFTPYEGMKVFGWPIMTILRGNVVYAHGKILREGSGEFIPRYPGVSQKSGLRKQVVSRANTRDI